MDWTQRKIVLATSFGKRYRGTVDIPYATFRTTDLLNASTVFWKNPNEKLLNDAILMYDVELSIDGGESYKKFDNLQVRLAEIVFFYDELDEVGNPADRLRAIAMREKAHEQGHTIHIISSMAGNAFYVITGTFYGLFKQKSHHEFIPLSDATVVEITRNADQLIEREINLPHEFLGVSTHHIESLG